ncbi:conserved hypothetical protein [Thioalkalivibrio sulfidiphilus HL-EbGr7]|uniref:Glycosyl transferase n=1 Tax=Thioalkalivibrio sulfidiphilus (strain HL-EbGR7) TaxID=396588 RepID=B8GL58_THISH|nr:hypothetical protein [Thioalkalivibrio sulfidiphilus]ACL71576.1 conserved hypothetical protein [Thioalkalivibrio sulfidiphilus HL-EbGr7]
MKTVLCIKWGTRYGPEYVNRIHAMVARNITPPFQVVCFTDDPRGIREEVRCHPLPDLGCPVPTNAPGKWSKVRLWNKDLYGLEGMGLFVDLDVVITGNLDGFFSFGDPDDVILARNWIKPLEKLGQTSVFRFPIGKHHELLENFRKDPEGIAARYQFEQRYVTRCVQGGIKFWPYGWVRHFRLDCLGPWPLRYLRPPRLPKDARIVIFPGKPDPADALLGRWAGEEPHLAPLAHLKEALKKRRAGEKGWFNYLKRYVRPAPWISEHWRE